MTFWGETEHFSGKNEASKRSNKVQSTMYKSSYNVSKVYRSDLNP